MTTDDIEFAEGGKPDKTGAADTITVKAVGEEIPRDDSFSFDGYQVVCGEFFAHTNDPTISFNGNKVYVNTACLKRLPDVERIQLLIHEQERNLVVRPSNDEEKGALAIQGFAPHNHMFSKSL